MAATTEAAVYQDRSHFTALDVVRDIWKSLELPESALEAISLPNQDQIAAPSSYKIGILAQASIGASALAASLVHTGRKGSKSLPPLVTVPLEHAAVEVRSERLYTIGNSSTERPKLPWGSIGGLHKTKDGYVRIHDSFPNHSQGTLKLLGLPLTATRQDVADKVAKWASLDLEAAGTERGNLAIYAMRTYQEWDAHPQSKAISDAPVKIHQLKPSPVQSIESRMNENNNRCLEGIRVVEMSRVIAAPVAGRTLAAHGADVLWVTSPHLPDLPVLDKDFSRGKRTIQLDIRLEQDKTTLLDLLRTADVFIQGYRPGSLAAYGLSPEELSVINPNLICANMSAFGPDGPWAGHRGFDSLVQTCTGMNVSEAEHANHGEVARAAPCQILDHSSGYLLATGIMAAIYHRDVMRNSGTWVVDASLAGAMKYLRSLGQYPGSTGFESDDYKSQADVPKSMLETRQTEFGSMTFVKHSATIQGCEVGWTEMPKALGTDDATWKHANSISR